MRVIVTLDYWDGRNKVSKPIGLEEVIGSLHMMLAEQGVASLAITRVEGLQKVADMANGTHTPKK